LLRQVGESKLFPFKLTELSRLDFADFSFAKVSNFPGALIR